MRTRALRALRFFDWVSGDELAELIGLTDVERGNGTLPNAMKRAVASGEVEMRFVAWATKSHEHTRGVLYYRITNDGKAALRAALMNYERIVSMIQCPECRGAGTGCECCNEIGMVHESRWRAWRRDC